MIIIIIKIHVIYFHYLWHIIIQTVLSFISYIHGGATVFEILDNFAAFVKNKSKIVTNEYTT